MAVDTVNHPEHYNTGELEVIDALEKLGLDSSFHLANAVKYICRCRHKGSFHEDLNKAIWYIRRAQTFAEKTHPMQRTTIPAKIEPGHPA